MKTHIIVTQKHINKANEELKTKNERISKYCPLAQALSDHFKMPIGVGITTFSADNGMQTPYGTLPPHAQDAREKWDRYETMEPFEFDAEVSL